MSTTLSGSGGGDDYAELMRALQLDKQALKAELKHANERLKRAQRDIESLEQNSTGLPQAQEAQSYVSFNEHDSNEHLAQVEERSPLADITEISQMLDHVKDELEVSLMERFEQGVDSLELLSITTQLRQLNDEPIDARIRHQLLVNMGLYTHKQQLDVLDFLASGLTVNDLSNIYPLLSSNNTEVQEEVLLRLQELPPNAGSIQYLQAFLAHTDNEWATKVATSLLQAAHL